MITQIITDLSSKNMEAKWQWNIFEVPKKELWSFESTLQKGKRDKTFLEEGKLR